MNRAIRQLIHGAVLRVLDDNGVTDQAERDRQAAMAIEEAERLMLPVVLRVQRAIDSMREQAEGKSEDWKAGARAVIEAIKKETHPGDMF